MLDNPDDPETKETEGASPPQEIIWQNVGMLIILHATALYGLTLAPTVGPAMWTLSAFTLLWSAMGVTAGVHRLWCHRSYKAEAPLRFFLAIGNSMAGQGSIYEWTKIHRVHHKCTETDGDPHDARRGFFFAHMGWLMCSIHPTAVLEAKTIDLSDLEEDSIVMFQHKNYVACMLTACFLIPTILPFWLWGESVTTSLSIAILRYCLTLHGSWLVNSAAHLYGPRPYDSSIGPRENLVVTSLAMGEGFHNYHHVFPQDYATSEWGYTLNISKAFIDLMAGLGQVHHRKTVTQEIVKARAERTGDVTLTKQWIKQNTE